MEMEYFDQAKGGRTATSPRKGKLTGAKPRCNPSTSGLAASRLAPTDYLFQGHLRGRHLTTRQYARLLADWMCMIGLDASLFGTHSLRRTKATLIYRKTGNLRAAQLLLGHTKIESTVRYLGIEVDDALAIAEQVEV
jgi:integrase